MRMNLSRFRILEYYENRVFGLDILRFIAILLVMGQHIGSQAIIFIPKKVYRAIFYFDGVTLFFVLSGYLIGKILVNLFTSKDFSFSKLVSFWKRRWLRTMPNYFLILVVFVSYTAIVKGIPIPNDIWEMFLFSHNLNQYGGLYTFRDSWSLSIEEWFYIIFPLLMYCFVRLLKEKIATPKILLLTCVTIILFSFFYKLQKSLLINEVSGDVYISNFRNVVLARFDTIMMGCLAAYAFVYHQTKWRKYRRIYLVLGIICVLANKFLCKYCYVNQIWGNYLYIYSMMVESIGFALMLPFFSNIRCKNGWLYRVVTFISLISYALYVINLNIVFDYVMPFISIRLFSDLSIETQAILNMAVFYIGSIIIAYVLFVFYEYPIMQMGRKKQQSK